jgi:hypothetical protein
LSTRKARRIVHTIHKQHGNVIREGGDRERRYALDTIGVFNTRTKDDERTRQGRREQWPVNVSSDQFRQKADECDKIADRAHFARIAARYRDLARRWREMAKLAERLERLAGERNPANAAEGERAHEPAS